jgi:transaldolase
MNQLEQLKKYTQVVADTGEIELIKKHLPLDATTNPSLILAAIQKPQYQSLLEKGILQTKTQEAKTKVQAALKKTTVLFGVEILKHIQGKVSTEIDARFSFDKEASIAQAKEIIALYKNEGVEKKRVLIKIAATWEGIQAARTLEQEGIHCNITLLFSLAQAIASANAGAYLISPFVGRILDWYKKARPDEDFQFEKDPGVQSVSKIYHYYKKCGIQTIVMGASFRSAEQIRQLVGCDKLTISPALLQELEQQTSLLEEKLTQQPKQENSQILSEAEFRFALNQDAMATEKLAEGIRKFSADTEKLEKIIEAKLS